MNVAATLMNSPAASSGSPGSQAANSSSPGGLDPQTTEKDFLQLLVAQLQNQDPLNPVDGTQFLSQITEINNVEQLVQANQTLTTIQTDLTANQAAGTQPAGNQS